MTGLPTPNENSSKIVKLLREGDREPSLLALKTGQTLTEVEAVIQERTAPKSPMQVLMSELNDAKDLVDLAKAEYQTAPSVDRSTAYVQILREMQSLIDKIDKYDDPAQKASEVVAEIQALLRRILKTFVSAIGSATADVPARYRSEVDDAMRVVAKQATRQFEATVQRVATTLGVADDILQDSIDIDKIKSYVENGKQKQAT